MLLRLAARPSPSLSLSPSSLSPAAASLRPTTLLTYRHQHQHQLRYRTTNSGTSAVPAGPSPVDVSEFDRLETRTFSIISHVDHGKSTLADRLLELTGTIATDGQNRQVLDNLKVERERGITVKSHAVSMLYTHPTRGRFLLNLIDCPGHVDFSYEVSRALGACQTALLVVDATQGVQAQSITVFQLALERNLRILPVLNKCDLPAANPDRCIAQINDLLGLDTSLPEHQPLRISAKTGHGVQALLRALVERTAPLPGVERGRTDTRDGPGLRALVFDSWYDQYRGVISLVSIADGAVRKGDKIASSHTGKRYEVLSLGVNAPGPISTDILRKGQVGWIIANMKDMSEALIGDTLHLAHEHVAPLEGFAPTVPMVYAGIFPVAATDFVKLHDAIQRLALNDRSVTVARESSAALGQGCRLGFLGLLHLDVFRQRLQDEYGHAILVTSPSVPYRITWKDGKQTTVSNPTDFPDDRNSVLELAEPMVRGTLRCPQEYTGAVMQLCAEHRGEQLDFDLDPTAPGTKHVSIVYRLPLSEIVTDFFDKLKSRSSGFASFDYVDDGYHASDLVRLNFLIASSPVDALAIVLHRSKATAAARDWCTRLRDVVPRQQFQVNIQAAVGSKILARETLSAYRKDVTAGLYGGHYERKLKHLNKQKEGKKRLKMMGLGRVQIPMEKYVPASSLPPPV